MQRGLTLVELLVGLALGLLIVAAATALLVGRIREHRALLVETRLMQDLRVATEIVTRDLRRAGHWTGAEAAVWPADEALRRSNPNDALAPDAAASDAASVRMSTGSDDGQPFGFRLHRGVIEMRIGDGIWQALTDGATLVVTGFTITPHVQAVALEGLCPHPCSTAAATCGPRHLVRSLAVTVSGRAAGDDRVVRTLRSLVRVRNDAVVGACPA